MALNSGGRWEDSTQRFIVHTAGCHSHRQRRALLCIFNFTSDGRMGESSPAHTGTHTCPMVQGKEGGRGRSWGLTGWPSRQKPRRNLTLSQGRGTCL